MDIYAICYWQGISAVTSGNVDALRKLMEMLGERFPDDIRGRSPSYLHAVAQWIGKIRTLEMACYVFGELGIHPNYRYCNSPDYDAKDTRTAFAEFVCFGACDEQTTCDVIDYLVTLGRRRQRHDLEWLVPHHLRGKNREVRHRPTPRPAGVPAAGDDGFDTLAPLLAQAGAVGGRHGQVGGQARVDV